MSPRPLLRPTEDAGSKHALNLESIPAMIRKQYMPDEIALVHSVEDTKVILKLANGKWNTWGRRFGKWELATISESKP